MEERQIIHNLKALQGIKPEKAWKQALKARILDNSSNQNPGKVFSWGFLPSWALKPSPIFVSGILAVLVITGTFILFATPSQTPEPADNLAVNDIIVSDLDTGVSTVPSSKIEEMLVIVRGVNELSRQAKELEKTADTPEKRQNLAILEKQINELANEAVRATIQATRESTSKEKETVEQEDLSVEISGIDNDIETETVTTTETDAIIETKPANNQEIKLVVETLIEIMQDRSLTEKQEDLLNQAKEYYNNEDYESALEAVQFLLTNNSEE